MTMERRTVLKAVLGGLGALVAPKAAATSGGVEFKPFTSFAADFEKSQSYTAISEVMRFAPLDAKPAFVMLKTREGGMQVYNIGDDGFAFDRIEFTDNGKRDWLHVASKDMA